jgi:hypothetical protein
MIKSYISPKKERAGVNNVVKLALGIILGLSDDED